MVRYTNLTARLNDLDGQGRADLLFTISINCRTSFLILLHGTKVEPGSLFNKTGMVEGIHLKTVFPGVTSANKGIRQQLAKQLRL